MNACVIFGAGEYDESLPCYDETDFYIAADGGLAAMERCGIRPDLLIGDFDSLTAAPLPGVPTVRLPVEKDVTDTDAAAAQGLKRGCRRFLFYGCMGGRPDHTLANLSLLARLSQAGCEATAFGLGFTVTALTDGAMELPAREHGTVSVFSWSERSEGVTIEGLKYGLKRAALTSSFALGVSNSFTGRPARVEVRKGTLLIMAQNA